MAEYDDEVPRENTMTIEELRREARRGWDIEVELIRALRNLPEVPNWRVLDLLSHCATHPNDWQKGKEMQRQFGLDAIGPRSEYESGAGVWWRIRNGLKPSD